MDSLLDTIIINHKRTTLSLYLTEHQHVHSFEKNEFADDRHLCQYKYSGCSGTIHTKAEKTHKLKAPHISSSITQRVLTKIKQVRSVTMLRTILNSFDEYPTYIFHIWTWLAHRQNIDMSAAYSSNRTQYCIYTRSNALYIVLQLQGHRCISTNAYTQWSDQRDRLRESPQKGEREL